MVRELRLADWPAPSSPEVISARELRVGDDRDRTVFGGVELHVWPGQLVGLYGPGPSGKSALLFTLAGRVSRVDGDLKVLGNVLPQHAHTVRTKVALISCRDTDAAADQARDAVVAGIELILLDDLDTVVNTAQRDSLRDLFTRSDRTTFVFTCQNPVLLQDILPPEKLVTVAMAAQPVGVA
jgi:RND superfamily putative drug exporter